MTRVTTLKLGYVTNGWLRFLPAVRVAVATAVSRCSIVPHHLSTGLRAFEQVVKPAYGTGGLGLQVLADLSTVKNGDVKEQSSLIVQQYIASPLLLDNRKFSVRLYAVSFADVPQFLSSTASACAGCTSRHTASSQAVAI